MAEEREEERLLGTLHFWLWMARAEVPVPWENPVKSEATAAERLRGLWREIREDEGEQDDWDRMCPCDPAMCCCDSADDVWGFRYRRMPQKPIHLFATQRQSRREQRQPRAVAAAIRHARRSMHAEQRGLREQ